LELALLAFPQMFPDAEIHLSRMTAIVLGIIYILYLVFQLVTHSEMFVSESADGDLEDAEEPALSAGAAGSMWRAQMPLHPSFK
jgi:Ca2+/H+ antiporter